jgi:hypothetical protein
MIHMISNHRKMVRQFLTLMLLSSATILSSCGHTTRYVGNSPCYDLHYTELKRKPIDSLTDREYTYFLAKQGECERYQREQEQRANDSQTLTRVIVYSIVGALVIVGFATLVF